jgi:hypothetical protein
MSTWGGPVKELVVSSRAPGCGVTLDENGVGVAQTTAFGGAAIVSEL